MSWGTYFDPTVHDNTPCSVLEQHHTRKTALTAAADAAAAVTVVWPALGLDSCQVTLMNSVRGR